MINTPRLILRQWQDTDLEAFCEMNADQEVMQYFPEPLSHQQSLAMAEKIRQLIDKNGWGFWAVERKNDRAFLGFVGLNQVKAALPCVPCVEVGWRLAKAYWGDGYATEAAQASINFGFNVLQLTRIVAFTATVNTPSIAVMQRLGMHNTQCNFGHPDVPVTHPLHEHVLYDISVQQYQNLKS